MSTTLFFNAKVHISYTHDKIIDMKKINTAPLSGMQELSPNTQALFNQLKQNIIDTYHSYGFIDIETPMIDRTEVLLAKAGGDTEKQIYKVVKTEESQDAADQALRFDHTVPLSRYIVQHQNELSFPFHVTQIGRNFRGERAQKGRFREFYQCDVDIIGREKLPISYDAKIIACIYTALSTFNLPKMRIRINNRKLVSGFIEALGLSELAEQISFVIDHAEKVSAEETNEALRKLDISDENVNKIFSFMHIHGDIDTVEKQLDTILEDKSKIQSGIDELRQISEILSAKKLSDVFEIDLMIVRGLDYYTGTVYEVFLDDYRHIGSISGGGRYENLCSNFSKQSFPGVGGSIGLTRLFYVLQENNFIEEKTNFPVNFVILPLSQNELAKSFEIADNLRNKGLSVDVDMGYEKKLGERFKRASAISSQAVVIGESEIKKNEFLSKNLVTGEIQKLELA